MCSSDLRTLMRNAVSHLRQNAPPHAVVFTDYESALELGYYGCGHGIVQEFAPFETFIEASCGPYTVITPRPDLWKFYAADLPSQLKEASAKFGLAPGTKLWLFNAGWITDSAPAIANDPQAGCVEPRSFGENVFVCQLAAPPSGNLQ